jgi:general secretion pathway protein J
VTSRAPIAGRTRRDGGFTLLEVTIAIAITAIMGVMVLGTFRQVDRAHEITRDQGDRYAAARLALSRLAREVSMAFISEHYDKQRLLRADERPTQFVGEEDGILFCTFAHQRLGRDVKESDQSTVEYTLDADPDHSGEQALFRREKPRIDEEPERGGRKDLVADHVTAFRLQYWDPKKNDWVREWSTKSLDHPMDLPSRVRFELEVKLPDGRTEKLSTEAGIALTRSLDF